MRAARTAAMWAGLECLESRVLMSSTVLAGSLKEVEQVGSHEAAIQAVDASTLDLTEAALSFNATPVTSQASALASPATSNVAQSASESSFYLPAQRRLGGQGTLLSVPSQGNSLEVARRFLVGHAEELGLTNRDLQGMTITDQYTDQDSGITHIYFRQKYRGLEVMNADLNINITAKGEVINVGSSFVSGLDSAAASRPTPSIDAPRAYVALSRALGFRLDSTPGALSSQPDSIDSKTIVSASGASLADVPANMVYVPTANGLELAWRLNIQTTDREHWYDAYVSAMTGQAIYAADWISHATYNVYAAPLESPNAGGRTIVTDPQDALASPYGWHDTDGASGAEFTDTQGNNVTAQEDQDANNTGGFRPSGGASLNFDFPVNLSQDPTAYQAAAIANLFYWSNYLHDVHYHYGFTEAAGNFQVNDYGRGGVGGDPVIVDAQDGGSVDNAHMSVPPDGQSPRMEMYLWDYTNPRRDPDFDNQVIIHEYGHGVSRRLTGGPANSNSLDALQSNGMNEGWSDWWALMFTQIPTDGKLDRYPIATYSYGQSSTGGGIRRYPYSFDMSVDPLTLNNFNGGSSNNEAHRAGEIWCSALWDLNWLLIDKYGFSSDLIAGIAGNNLALRLVMEAQKLQPSNPSFLAGRDAILAADQTLTGGQNQTEIWTAFARRGMGFSASDGGNANATIVTAAFDLPPTATISGNVFRDDDGNGLRSGTEPGLAGWTVYRDSNNNGSLDLITTATFNSTDTPKAITDPGTTYSNLTISGLYGTITDVNVTVNLSHPYDGQIYVSMLSPGGIPVILANYLGGSGQNYTNTTFDDEAAAPIASGTAPFTGTFIPYMALSRFDGVSPNGTWKLRLDDSTAGQAGTILSWSMQITYAGGEPSTVTDANGNYTFSNMPNGTYRIREVNQSGFSVTAPASGVYNVTISGGQPAVGINFGNKSTVASATPGAPDLVDTSDTGTSNSDNLTKLDNAAPGNLLQFIVPNTIAGALVKLYADGVMIGSATATSGTTLITTNGAFDLSDGSHTITARQTEVGLSQSAASSSLAIQVDTLGPNVTVNQHVIQADPTSSSNIYFTAAFSEVVTGFAVGDVTIGGTAGATTVFIGTGTSTYDFLINGMTNSGTVIATTAAGVATDAAGNANNSSTTTDNVVTYLMPAPEIAVSGLGQSIADGDSTPVAADGTDFGKVTVGDPTVTRTFTVTNTGSVTLTLGSVSVPVGFALGADALATSLAPGASDTFSIDMTTSAAGTYAGDVTFTSNDSDENPFNFRITGTVNALVNTAPTIASLTDSPDPVSQGSTITLTANGVSDPDAGDAVLAVQFFRDTNGDGNIDAGDLLLGTDYDGTDGWSWSGSTSGFPLGTIKYLASAYDGTVFSAPTAATGTVNPVVLPVVGALAVSATALTRPANLTLTASSVSDPGGYGVTAVQFYRDSNANGVLDAATDQLLGTDSNGADGWTWTGSTLGFDVGTNRYFSRAQSAPGVWGAAAVKTNTINNAIPTTASLTATPSTVTLGSDVTLTAGTVADTDGSVMRVEFYRDLNNNSVIDVSDELLGADTDGSNGWTATASSATFPPGTVRYLSRAQDNNGAWSSTRSMTGTVNVLPTITSIAPSMPVIYKGDNITITASGVGDTSPGTVSAVEFYRDINGNGQIDIGTDSSLGSDTSSAGGWTITVSTSAFPVGNVTLMARTKDNNSGYSPTVTNSVFIDAKPTVGSLTIPSTPLIPGNALTLTAVSVADTDGTVTNAEFYRDVNGNSVIDVGTDQLLAADSNGADGWSVVVPGSTTAGLPTGSIRYMVRVQDNLGAWSTARATSGYVSNPPTVGALTGTPSPVNKGSNLTLSATGVSEPDVGQTVSSVTFYRDSNSNGVWDTSDASLGTDTNSADGWTWTGSTSSFTAGTNRFFARAKDSVGLYSTIAAMTTVTVNALPVVTVPTSSLAYASGSAATLLASTGTVSDANSADFDTGKLTVLITAGGTSFDRLGVRNQGIAAGMIGISGANVLYSGLVIGTWSGGTDGFTPLVISLNANATVAATQALLRNITYFNAAAAGTDSGNRSIGFTIDDGDGGISTTTIRPVTVT